LTTRHKNLSKPFPYLPSPIDNIVIAALPVRPIEKGIAGPGLLAHPAISPE
jgi:transposase